MKVLIGLRLRYAMLTLLALFVMGMFVGCGGGDENDPKAIQATKESESKYEQVIKDQAKKK